MPNTKNSKHDALDQNHSFANVNRAMLSVAFTNQFLGGLSPFSLSMIHLLCLVKSVRRSLYCGGHLNRTHTSAMV